MGALVQNVDSHPQISHPHTTSPPPLGHDASRMSTDDDAVIIASIDVTHPTQSSIARFAERESISSRIPQRRANVTSFLSPRLIGIFPFHPTPQGQLNTRKSWHPCHSTTFPGPPRSRPWGRSRRSRNANGAPSPPAARLLLAKKSLRFFFRRASCFPRFAGEKGTSVPDGSRCGVLIAILRRFGSGIVPTRLWCCIAVWSMLDLSDGEETPTTP